METPHREYAALVARQLAALQAEDLELVDALADQRDQLAAGIAAAPASPELLEALAAAAELDTRFRAELGRRRAALLEAVHDEQGAAPRLHAYVRAAQALVPRAVDLTL